MNQRALHLFISLVFVGILLSAAGLQVGLEVWRGEAPQFLDLFKNAPSVANLRAYEKRLEEESWLARQLRPWMQYAQYVLLRDAGDKVLRGPNGWFFYKPGVEYLTQREPLPAANSEDPVTAICAFRDQLAARGIHLVVIPAPNKESIYPEELSHRASRLPLALCEQTQSLLDKLQTAGVDTINLFELFAQAKSPGAGRDVSPKRPAQQTPYLYLAQDSHWSPAGLELAARTVGQRLIERNLIDPGRTVYQTRPFTTHRLGDVVRMMQVPQIEKHLAEEEAPCVQVIDPDTLKPLEAGQEKSSVLVLGDSFLRIFEQDEPGSAGFIAHLAKELRQPVAAIVNDGGASTLVRQELYRRPKLLQNKRVVIWEFVERDIRFGTEGWQLVPLPPARISLFPSSPTLSHTLSPALSPTLCFYAKGVIHTSPGQRPGFIAPHEHIALKARLIFTDRSTPVTPQHHRTKTFQRDYPELLNKYQSITTNSWFRIENCILRGTAMSRAFSASDFFEANEPRALPWAGMNNAVGVLLRACPSADIIRTRIEPAQMWVMSRVGNLRHRQALSYIPHAES